MDTVSLQQTLRGFRCYELPSQGHLGVQSLGPHFERTQMFKKKKSTGQCKHMELLWIAHHIADTQTNRGGKKEEKITNCYKT